jgi:NAD(P)-dependent dehydrogenase (short-subunit alcohol dehydrogenase family)
MTFPKTITLPKNKQLIPTKIEKGLVVVFGGSGEIGMSITKKLLTEKYTVINVSRRKSRWIEGVIKNNLQSYVSDGQLQWVKADVRIYKEIVSAMKIITKLGSIDTCINISIIKPNSDLLNDNIPTLRDDRDLFLRLPGAYDHEYNGKYDLHREGSPGNEHSLFTNLIGMLNLNKSQKEFKIEKIINLNGIDELSDTLLSQIGKRDPNNVFNVSLDEIQNILSLI